VNSLRRTLGLVLACLAPAVAIAQVTVYGTANVNLQSTEASGATSATSNVKSRLGVSVDSSNVGVRAALKVNDMLSGVAQCETSANVDGIAGAVLCNRNSRVGLTFTYDDGKKTIGTLFYGNWDTPYKAAAYGTKADDPFGNTDVFDAASIVQSPGFNTKTGAYSVASNTVVTSFALRAQNAVAFHSGVFPGGLSFRLHYTTNEFKASGSPVGAVLQNPELYSAAVNWESGTLIPMAACSAFGAWEQHKDGFGLLGINPAPATGAYTLNRFGATAANSAGTATAALHTTDTGLRFGAGCEVPLTPVTITVGGVYEMLTFEQSAAVTGSLKKYDRNAWHAGLKLVFPWVFPIEIRGRYSVADKGSASIAGGAASSTTDYGASMLAAGAAIHLAPTLQVYAFYTQITNDRNAQYTFGTAGAAAVAGATPVGADPQAFGLGARMAF